MSWKWTSSGMDACMTPVIPANRKLEMKPMQNHSGVCSVSLPPHIVASQLKTFTPVGTAMIIDVIIIGNRIAGATPSS